MSVEREALAWANKFIEGIATAGIYGPEVEQKVVDALTEIARTAEPPEQKVLWVVIEFLQQSIASYRSSQ